MNNAPYDCIVVGGGPAGLSASLFLARYRHRVATFHHNSPRNEYSHGVHGFLGQHGIPPAQLLAQGRAEVREHGGIIIEAQVTAVEQIDDDHFLVTASAEESIQTTAVARRLVIATGLRDLTPECPGFREFYGVSVHHCPDCDGYESRDRHIAVLGNGHKTAGFALSLLTWTNRVTLITGGEIGDMSAAHQAKLANQNIKVLDKTVAALEGDLDTKQLRRVRFTNGDSLDCDVLFFNLGTELASDLHAMLGCKLDEESGLVWVDEKQQTSVAGVYAAGDITPDSQLAIVAAAEGAMAAIHLHQSLLSDDLKL